MEVLAVIPARGGSKGLPGKNIRPMCGKPLIAHNILAAQAAESVDTVFVSTDSKEITEAASFYGAQVAPRPESLAGDKILPEAAIVHMLNELASMNYRPDIVAFLQCTTPSTTADDIDQCVAKLIETEADVCFTAGNFFHFTWEDHGGEWAVGMNHSSDVRPMRQDREKMYIENGGVYAMRTGGFMRAKHRFFGKIVIHEVPPERCFEIDDQLDWDLCEFLMQRAQKVTP